MSNKISQLIIDDQGNEFWRLTDKRLHRDDGPAIEWISGIKEWWVNGKRQREDGPAITFSDDEKWWFLNNIKYSYEEWFQQLTPEQQYNYLWNLNE